jgi:hypothetical protein
MRVRDGEISPFDDPREKMPVGRELREKIPMFVPATPLAA